jgi:acyl-CoA thioester hydrolase
VRWSDLDAYGHVNNARFLTLYEEARVAMFFIGARAHGLTSFEEGIVIARHEIDYLRPVDYSAGFAGATESPQVRVELWISDLRAARFTVNYELFDGTVLASRAKSVCVPYHLAQAHPRRLTEPERAFLKPYLTE